MCRVSENAACKMSIANLATVFGPTVVGYSSANPTMNDIMVQTKLQRRVRTGSLSVCNYLQFVNIDSPCNVLQTAVYVRWEITFLRMSLAGSGV